MKMLRSAILACLFFIDSASVFAAPSGELLSKVVNGQDATPGSHPHQVSLQWTFFGGWYHVCGGSVIDDNFVLTAAHCVDFGAAEEFRVAVNDHRLFEPDGTEQYIGVKRIEIHDNWINTLDYDLKIYPNDIALLQLDTEVLDKSTIVPMATDEADDFAGVECTISGWGRNDTDSPLPNILQETNMTVMSLPDCAAYWDQLWPDTPLHLFMGQICIFSGEDPVLGASACNGDSGGPMICNGLLAGVTSWGVFGCRDETTKEFRPSVYARVSYYYPWIQAIMGKFTIGRG